MIHAMRWAENKRFILCFAITGFTMAVIAWLCVYYHASNILTNLTILLSPPMWLLYFPLGKTLGYIPFLSPSVAKSLMVAVTAASNGLLYGIAGAIVAFALRVLRKKVV
jgi:hypothetical protein